ncbi:adenylate cyclase [Sphingomonas sp. YR710]|uniref:adenylate/guanylate cyclase domain-containing protein n=1 Tax=Sphingomonas sp. YR710 TaxID=1882773 RepID=UPI00088EEA94|nr:adenylate/guanylate cyclase domain-containing protein [Sphingomonas sp. YR710]SDC50779.1 adenylate cyclase [Sphingomonas sp. YR710]
MTHLQPLLRDDVLSVSAPDSTPIDKFRLIMRLTIGFKILGIAIGLLVLTMAAALTVLRMTQKVDDQLALVSSNYLPAYANLALANNRSLAESAYIRREMLALGEDPRDDAKVSDLQRRAAAAAADSDRETAQARRRINEQIDDALDFDDNVALARLDTRIEFLQDERRQYEGLHAQVLDAARNRRPEVLSLLTDLDRIRDDYDQRIGAAQGEMRRLADQAIADTRAYQRHVIQIGLGLLIVAGLLGITIAAAVTKGLVRPVHRLLAGTVAVQGGALDTVVAITSSDEIGRLTQAFNHMVGELRTKAQIRETFGKYVDPRIVAGLLDRPELTDPQGARREMTILFCDMAGFTSFSERMTPVGLVNVMNRYLTMLSDPVRRNSGIIDKYIGDAIMAFWGPPFVSAEDEARLACFAAIEQLAVLPFFQAELPDLTGVRHGFPQIGARIGIATGDVVVGNIGSEQTRNYTVLGDTVNVASRLEGVNKVYGTRILISQRTHELAGDAVETREIDSVLVVGKNEPERIFEVLGRRGEVAPERLELRDTFAAALADYRAQKWDISAKGFRACLSIVPDDPASQLFLDRIGRLRIDPPPGDWGGVWTLKLK